MTLLLAVLAAALTVVLLVEQRVELRAIQRERKSRRADAIAEVADRIIQDKKRASLVIVDFGRVEVFSETGQQVHHVVPWRHGSAPTSGAPTHPSRRLRVVYEGVEGRDASVRTWEPSTARRH